MTSNAEYKVLLEINKVPLLQNVLYKDSEEARACPHGNIRLIESLSSGLIFNDQFDPSLMVYESSYLTDPEVSLSFQDHLDNVAGLVLRHLDGSRLTEIGCGQGFFLEALSRKGANIIGYDPSYRGDNPDIKKEYFHRAGQIKQSGDIILRHVLEHIPNPIDFLFNLKLNYQSSRLYIEVPCFDWICKNKSWVDIFYEHVNYFRPSDFLRMFTKIIASGHIFGGQYFYIVAELSSLTIPVKNAAETFRFPIDFMNIDFSSTRHSPVAIWGSGAKGVMFAIHALRANQPISFAVDINPKKNGKFLPSTGIEVISPSRAIQQLKPGSSIYVMNCNYLAEIKSMTNNAFHYIDV